MGGRLFITELAVPGVGLSEDSVALVFTLIVGRGASVWSFSAGV